MLKPHNFTEQEIALDRYIRSGVLSFRKDAYTLEPTHMFTENVLTRVREIERQKNVKMTILFAVIALAPFLSRELWFIVRNNFIHASSLPLGKLLIAAYKIFLKSGSAYVFIGGGFLLALYIVGLPKWRIPYLQHLSKN